MTISRFLVLATAFLLVAGPIPATAITPHTNVPQDVSDLRRAVAPRGQSDSIRVLIYSRTAGFRHANIPHAIAMLLGAGPNAGIEFIPTEDPRTFTDDLLIRFDCVVFLSTTGDILDEAQEDAFERYIQAGGGYVGIHAAADTEYDWPWYGGLVGAYFDSHPAIQDATILVNDRFHPSTRHLPRRWDRRDEWYNYRDNPRGRVHVLASLDERTYQGGGMGHDHPIAWCHEYDGGRAWYTGGGHTEQSFNEPDFIAHIIEGIRWAAGLEEDADAGATINDHFEKIVLEDQVTDPMELAIAPDGRVIFVERAGAVRIWKPDTRATVTAGVLDVFTGLEDGLLGVALDPRFPTNGFIYLMYARVDRDANVVSRFRLIGDTLDITSERELLEIPTQREECCHSGGSLTFDRDGNLYISTGDNTSPFASGGFTPIDERRGRAPFDAQKSSANTNDLRGKILRITPQPDGTYTIPQGNLFPDRTNGRPEIYVMGCRNPFRIAVDPRTGTLYWGEVGPDASAPNPERGPAGYDEFNRTTKAGNFGWPYAIGPNDAYVDYDFETDRSSKRFDPQALLNQSPNNTGATVLPPARPAWIWYPYAASERFPELGNGGRCAMAGPIVDFSPRVNRSRFALPAYYDRTAFLYEWARDWILAVQLDENDRILDIHPFLEDMSFKRPMDMELGPDGRLYLIEWGQGFGGGNPDAQIIRIDYFADGERPPSTRTTAAPTSGAIPLTVTFDARESRARSGPDALTFAWDFDGDGEADATDPLIEHTFNRPGVYEVQLTVTDADGRSTVANETITAGNTRPDVTIAFPPHGGIVSFGEHVEFLIDVRDDEDVVFDATAVTVQSFLGHDTHAHPLHQGNDFGGVFRTLRDDGHGADADLFTVFTAVYSDLGAAGAPALTDRAEVILQPRRKQAEYMSDRHQNVRVEKTDDPDGGGQAVVLPAPGAWAAFAPVHFRGITGARLRASGSTSTTRLALRVGAPNGPDVQELADIDVPPTAPVTLTAGQHDLRLEYFERGGGAGVVLSWAGTDLAKEVVPTERFLPPDERTDLPRVSYYTLNAPDRLPDFSAMEPISVASFKQINFPSTSGTFADSGRADDVGAVFEARLDVPSDGAYAFFLASDDGARLFINGDRVIDHDGLHGMTEKTVDRTWHDLDVDLRAPDGTQTLYVVRTDDEVGEVRLNWIEFKGRGVASNKTGTTLGPAARHGHSHE